MTMDAKDLSNLYTEQGLSIYKIAERTGICKSSIHQLLVKYNIPRRTAYGSGGKRHVGHTYINRGYVYIVLERGDFFYPTASKAGHIAEHRLVMAKSLGKNLHTWELVHHINGIKDDNRRENLQLVTDDRHRQITILENRIVRLEDKVEEQAKLIKLIQWQNREINKKEVSF